MFRWRSCLFFPLLHCLLASFFSATFCIPFFGQKCFKIKLYSDSYVFIIRNLWILGCPLSFGSSRTIEVSHWCRGDACNSAMNVMVGWSFIILSPKSGSSFDYWILSGLSRYLWCPKCLPEGEVAVFSFQFLDPSTYLL